MLDIFRTLTVKSFADNHYDGFAWVNDDQEILSVNRNFFYMMGFSCGPLSLIESLLEPESRDIWHSELSGFLSERRNVFHKTLKTSVEDAEQRIFDFSLINLDSAEGFIFQIADFTTCTYSDKQLIKAAQAAEEAARLKGVFLANTSHEIRTPIQTLVGLSDLMSQRELDAELSDYVNQIQFATGVLCTLIDDILDFSRIEAGSLSLEEREFNLHRMLEDVSNMVTLAAHRKNVDVGMYYSPDVPAGLIGDSNRLRQVIVNLMNNAVKFTRKGEIILDVEVLDSNNLNHQDDTVYLRFSVQDSGIGIPRENQKNIFKPFQQAENSIARKYGGTGLGLCISKNIVEQMGGAMNFESVENQGSCFFFDIVFRKVTESDYEPLIPSESFREKKILLVDDNREIRIRIKQMLDNWGFQVQVADSADEALGLLDTSEGALFDLVIVDQAMPSMDGWQFASRVQGKRNNGSIKVILMSMKGDNGAVEARMKLLNWFDGYLNKPICPGNLVSTLLYLFRNGGKDDLELLESVDESEGEKSPPKGRRILVAEDHEVNRRLLRKILEKNNQIVTEAVNGRQACELLQTEEQDMVLMDCQMPVMSGYEAAKIMRRLDNFQGPIIAVTAATTFEEKQKCRDCGMDDIITKPFREADILQILEDFPGIEDCRKNAGEVNSRELLCAFDLDAVLETFLGDRELVVELSEAQTKRMWSDMKSANEAVKHKDWEKMRIIGHSVKGSCLSLHMNPCAQVGEQLEKAGFQKDIYAAESAVERFGDCLEELETEVSIKLRQTA